MVIKYDVEINNEVIIKELKKITNLIYKLLPSREENIDWEKPLETIIEELFNFFKFPAHCIHHRFLLVFQHQSS